MDFDSLLQNIQNSQPYQNASKWANKFGFDLPQSKLISPLPESKTLTDILGIQKAQAAQITPTPTPSPIPTPTLPPDQGALPYYEDINAAAASNNVPQDILYRLLKAESSWNPDTISGKNQSPAGAQGIAQFMPTTSAGMGFDPLNPKEAIPAAAKYLRSKYDEGGEDWKLALARYNAGSGNVRKYGGVPPFKETLDYIQKIMGEQVNQ